MLRRYTCHLSNTFRQTLLSLSVVLCGAGQVVAEESSQLPLLVQAKALQCAESEAKAKVALGAFWEVQDSVGNFPDQHFLKNEKSTLHAATLDILLNSLVKTAERFPALRSQVERTMLQWNYCDVMQDGVLFNLESDGMRVNRSLAAKTSPIAWQGFKSVGFFGEVEGRFVPELISSDQQSLRVDFEWLFHRIYREQCFPHPDTSDLFDRLESQLSQKLTVTPEADKKAYPYDWNPKCVSPMAVPDLKANLVIDEPLIDVPTLQTKLSVSDMPLAIPRLKTSVIIAQAALSVPKLTTKVVVDEVKATIPKLATKLVIDKPKVAPVAKQKPAVVTHQYHGGATHNHKASGGGSVIGGVGHTHNTPVAPVAKVVQVASPKKTTVVDSKQAMLERILMGLSTGGNVLIVDKIELTVNEYNGTVETVISNSDVTNSSLPLPSATPASKVQQFVKDQKLPAVKTNKVITQATAKPSLREVRNGLSALPVNVPMVESLVFVESSAASSAQQSKSSPKPVVIKKKVNPLVDVPRLQTQLKLSANKPTRRRSSKKTKQPKITNNGSYSLFIYEPYENGAEPKPGEKTVEELLQEYAEYEASRQAAKKKEVRNDAKPKIKPTPKALDKQTNAETKSQPTKRSRNTASQGQQEVEISRLQTQVFIEPPKKVKKVATQSSSKPQETVLVASAKLSKDDQPSYTFSEKTPDAPQLTATSTNIPVGLALDAPTPYVIDEIFIDEKPVKGGAEKAKKKPIGLAGNVYLKQSLNEGRWAIGGSINRKLFKDDYWFARAGWNYALENEEDPFSYSWGIGYSDWHPGTFSAQLNNWGPIKPGEGLAFDKAIASFGYSVKSEVLKKYRLSASGALNIPIDGNSTASANFRWSPKENWYINTSLSYPIEGDGEPKWTYGFGYSDWRPDKFNLQYSNYGPNDLFEDNYKKNGTWSFSYNWKF